MLLNLILVTNSLTTVKYSLTLLGYGSLVPELSVYLVTRIAGGIILIICRVGEIVPELP